MDFKIKEPVPVEPIHIMREVRLISEKIEKFYSKELSKIDYEYILHKISSGRPLTAKETRAVLYNQYVFSGKKELEVLFKTFLTEYVTKQNFSFLFKPALLKFSPWNVIKYLETCKQENLNSEIVPFVLRENISSLKRYNSREEFISSYARSYKNIMSFLKDFEFITEEQAFFSSIIASSSSYSFFSFDTENFLKYLFKVNGVSGFNTIEAHLLEYMNDNKNWSSTLGAQNSFLSSLIQMIFKYDFPPSAYGVRLKEVFDVSQLIKEAFDQLREKSGERAYFWESISSRFSQISPRRFKKEKLIGLALYLPKHVIVEFAPSGNAAFIYTREVFEEKIKDSNEWKMKELAGDPSIKINSFVEAEDYIRTGHFWHRRNRWQDDMLHIIKRLEVA